MNIGIVCYPTYGGSGVVATELGIALAQKGHQVHFITSHQPVKLNFLTHNLHFHEVFVETPVQPIGFVYFKPDLRLQCLIDTGSAEHEVRADLL